MKYLSLRKYSQFDNPRVIAKVRRAILAAMAGGECVCVLEDGAVGLTDAARTEIGRDWPPSKVQFSVAHPSASIGSAEKKRRTRRPRP